MANWINYWTGDTMDREVTHVPLNHTAANKFYERGVRPGDTVFVLSFRNGDLFIVARLVVAEIVGQSAAEQQLGHDLWQAKDHLIAVPGRSTAVRNDAIVPDNRMSDIGFIDKSGARSHPKRNNGKVEPQTFRHIRQIDSATATLFESVLASPPT